MTEQTAGAVPDTITAVAEYNATAAALADLKQRYALRVYDVTTSKGMKEAIDGRAELRRLRVDLEKKRVEIKAPALKRCQLIDSEAKRITAELSALEDPIDAQIKTEEQRKEAERAERERREQERLARINDNIASLHRWPLVALRRNAAEIEQLIADLVAEPITADGYAEFIGAAEIARASSLAALRHALEGRQQQEAEAAELARRKAAQDAEEAAARARREEEDRARDAVRQAEEADALAAKQRRVAEEADAKRQREEQDRVARETREREHEAARARIAEEEHNARVRREVDERQAKAVRETEEKRIADERARVVREAETLRQRQEAEAKARSEREEREQAEREAAAAKQRAEDEAREAAKRRAAALVQAKHETIEQALEHVLFVAGNRDDYGDAEARAEITLIAEANLPRQPELAAA